MSLTDLGKFDGSQYPLASSNGSNRVGGTCYNGYAYVLSFDSSSNTVFLTKSTLFGNRLWELPFYSSETWYFGDGYDSGGLIIHNERIYYKNQIDNTVCWVPFTDPIVANQSPTKILDCGTGADTAYHAFGDYEKAWWGKVVNEKYIFHIEPGTHSILVTDLDGNFIGRFGEYGTLLGQFQRPTDLVFYPPDRIYVCEWDGYRIAQWRINSWENPFSIEPVETTQLADYRYHAKGIGYKANQLIISIENSGTNRHRFEYYKINENFSLTHISSTEGGVPHVYGFGACTTDSKYVEFGGLNDAPVKVLTGSIRAVDNTASLTVSFDIYALVSGVQVDINFILESGVPQILGDVSLDIEAEGYIQQNTVDEKFFFALDGFGGHYDMIADFGFDLTGGEHGVRESFAFDLFASQNYLANSFSFELYTETSITKFSELEESFGFELLASSPHSGRLSLELETLELHSKAAADIIGTCQFLLEPLIVEAYEGPTSELVLPALEVEASISVPSTGVSQLILPELSVVTSASVPSVASMVLELEGLSAEGQVLIHGQLNGVVVLPSLVTQGIMSMGASSAQILAVINNLKVNSWGAVVPSITGALVLSSLAVSSSQNIQLYSISELYDGNSLIHIPGADYYQVDLSSLSDLEENLFDVQGLAINLGTKAITKLGHPATYNVIDLGYLDVHKVAVMDYLIVYLYGDMPTEEDLVGQLVIGDYSYEIKRWITDGEWRVVIGKGLTKQSFRGPSVRYQRILLQLKDGFELKGITILATPNPRRLR